MDFGTLFGGWLKGAHFLLAPRQCHICPDLAWSLSTKLNLTKNNPSDKPGQTGKQRKKQTQKNTTNRAFCLNGLGPKCRGPGLKPEMSQWQKRRLGDQLGAPNQQNQPREHGKNVFRASVSHELQKKRETTNSA